MYGVNICVILCEVIRKLCAPTNPTTPYGQFWSTDQLWPHDATKFCLGLLSIQIYRIFCEDKAMKIAHQIYSKNKSINRQFSKLSTCYWKYKKRFGLCFKNLNHQILANKHFLHRSGRQVATMPSSGPWGMGFTFWAGQTG